MILEYIRYRIPVEHGPEFAAAYARGAAVLDADEHCLGYDIAQGVEEPENWVVRISWDSLEGHEQGFRAAPHFRDFFAAVRPYVTAIQEMKHYRVEQAS
ncbi:MAG TPA: antibiotic biosynthesis monooxygenase [Mycobacteriales bacterium]|nr:antibiotic biosynthesis monooxygenase [Mycobacteriales bacterium]